MAEYIEREALVEWLKRIPLIDLSDGRGLCRVIMEDDFKKAIKKIPKGTIADVAPVRHGRWEVRGQEVFCTNCDKESGYNAFGASAFSDYCPNCGAKMDGEP